jgi:gliding motility-associated-like protein
LPNVIAGNDFISCENDVVVLTGSGASTYVWDNGVTNGVGFTPAGTATYTVIGTDANGCVNIDQVTVTVSPNPIVSFTADITSGCAPLTVTFTNTTPGTNSNCVWSLGNGTTLTGCGSVTTTFTQPGLFDVGLTTTINADGCVGTVNYADYIYVEAVPVASFTPSSSVISVLNTQVLFDNTSTNATNYQWDFGDESPVSTEVDPIHNFPNLEPGNYVVELIATSPLGCADTAVRVIIVNEELIFYVPNTFTPDGDDYNEYFQPVFTSGYDPFDFNLFIFNRWGELIWESHDATVGWDGTYGVGESIRVQDGTYTWKIDFKTSMNDKRVEVVGHVNIIR